MGPSDCIWFPLIKLPVELPLTPLYCLTLSNTIKNDSLAQCHTMTIYFHAWLSLHGCHGPLMGTRLAHFQLQLAHFGCHLAHSSSHLLQNRSPNWSQIPRKQLACFLLPILGWNRSPGCSHWVPFGALWAPSCALREQSGDKMWDFPTSGEKKGALSTITCPKSTPWLYIYIYIISSSYYIYNISLDLYDFLHILQVIPLAKCYGIYSNLVKSWGAPH